MIPLSQNTNTSVSLSLKASMITKKNTLSIYLFVDSSYRRWTVTLTMLEGLLYLL